MVEPKGRPDTKNAVIVTGFERNFSHVRGKDVIISPPPGETAIHTDLLQFLAREKPNALFSRHLWVVGHRKTVLGEYGVQHYFADMEPGEMLNEVTKHVPTHELSFDDEAHLKSYLHASLPPEKVQSSPPSTLKNETGDIVKLFRAMGFPEKDVRSRIAEHVKQMRRKP